MQNIQFRLLKPDEIECRPAMVKDGKVTILLYITSRAVVRLLNETVGPMNWNMDFTEVNGQLVGKLGIWDEEKGAFVYKSDTGSESNIEAQKGLFSDCYKRCLSRWGVDELYTAPRIKVDDDGYGCSGYKVSNIQYNDNREIIALTIVNRFGKPVYSFPVDGQNKPVEEDKATILKNFCTEMKSSVLSKDELLKFYNYYDAILKKNGWKGAFNPDVLWRRWLENN